MRSNKYLDIDPSSVKAIPGWTIDPTSGYKAHKRSKKYHRHAIFWFVLFCLNLFPIVVLRITGNFNGSLNSFVYLWPLSVFAYCGAFCLTKELCYTGHDGLEQISENGSPFWGNLVYKNGFIRIGNLLSFVVLQVLSYAVSFFYTYLIRVEYTSHIPLRDGVSSVFFCFSTIAIAMELSTVMVYKWRYFFKSIWISIRERVPIFFTYQLFFTVISSLLFLIVRNISNDQEIISGLSDKIIGEALETSSVVGFLAGKTSVLTSLAAASMYVNLISDIVDICNRPINESPKSYKQQFLEMVKDGSNLRVILLLVTSIIFSVLGNTTTLNTILRYAVLLVWLYNAFKEITTTKFSRYIYTYFSMIYIDQLVVVPSVIDSGLWALGVFLIRIFLFIVVGVMIGFTVKFMDETKLYSKKSSGAMDVSLDDLFHKRRRSKEEQKNGQTI